MAQGVELHKLGIYRAWNTVSCNIMYADHEIFSLRHWIHFPTSSTE